jgi:hypothetical protein
MPQMSRGHHLPSLPSYLSLISLDTSHRPCKVPISLQLVARTTSTKSSCPISSMDSPSTLASMSYFPPNPRLSMASQLTGNGSYPPDTPEKQKLLAAFFGGIGAPPKSAAKVPAIVEAMKKHNPNIKSFGIVGVSALIPPRFHSLQCANRRLSYAGAAK